MQTIVIIQQVCQQHPLNRQLNPKIQTANVQEFEWKAMEIPKAANKSKNRKTYSESQQSALKPRMLFKLCKNQAPKQSPLQTKLRLAPNSISLIT